MKCFRNQWSVITVSNIKSLSAHFVFYYFTLSPTGVKKTSHIFSDCFFWITKKKCKFNIWKPEQTLSEKYLIDPVSNCKLKWKSKVSANIVICVRIAILTVTSPIVINAPIRGILAVKTKTDYFLLWLAKFKYQKTCL